MLERGCGRDKLQMVQEKRHVHGVLMMLFGSEEAVAPNNKHTLSNQNSRPFLCLTLAFSRWRIAAIRIPRLLFRDLGGERHARASRAQSDGRCSMIQQRSCGIVNSKEIKKNIFFINHDTSIQKARAANTASSQLMSQAAHADLGKYISRAVQVNLKERKGGGGSTV